jgi:hypothetical protein
LAGHPPATAIVGVDLIEASTVCKKTMAVLHKCGGEECGLDRAETVAAPRITSRLAENVTYNRERTDKGIPSLVAGKLPD